MKKYLQKLVVNTVNGENSDLTFYEWVPVRDITLDENIFGLVKRRYAQEVADSLNNQSAIQRIRTKIIGTYLSKMYAQQVAPIFIEALRNDSFYVTQLINLLSSSSLPVTRIETTTDTVPKFRSELLIINDKSTNVAKTILVDKLNSGSPPKDSADIVSFSYKKGKRTLVEVSFGLSYTLQHVWVQKNDQNKITSKDERFRGVAALHFYPFRGKGKTRPGLYKIDEPFFGSFDRINIMIGAGVPKPLDNY
jgi:hypothetical protein